VEEKWRGGKWEEGEGSRGSSWPIYRGGGGGLWCTMSKMIGRRWQCSGTALCARCRGLLGFIGGCVVQSKHGRVQSGYDRIQARPDGCGAPRCKVGWQRIDVTTPCRRACSARLGGVRVLRNTQHALRMLGGMVASGWHGRGAVRGGSEVAASHGIGHGRAGKLDGEVTGREVVGAALPMLGTHGGYSDDQGQRGVAGARSLQGGARVWVPVRCQRRGFCRAVPRAPPPPSIQSENDKGKGVFGDLLNPEKILVGPFPPLGQFAKEK
jgi:hypothetical protein